MCQMSFCTAAMVCGAKDAPQRIIPLEITETHLVFRRQGFSQPMRTPISQVLVESAGRYYRFQPSPFRAPLATLRSSYLVQYLLQPAPIGDFDEHAELAGDFSPSLLAAASTGAQQLGVSDGCSYGYFCALFAHLTNTCQIGIFRPRRQWACLFQLPDVETSAQLRLILEYGNGRLWEKNVVFCCIERLYHAYQQIGARAYSFLCRYLHCGFGERELLDLFALLVRHWPELCQDLGDYRFVGQVEEVFPENMRAAQQIATARQDFQAESERELSVVKGQTLYLMGGDMYGWMLCQNVNGEQGWVCDVILEIV